MEYQGKLGCSETDGKREANEARCVAPHRRFAVVLKLLAEQH